MVKARLQASTRGRTIDFEVCPGQAITLGRSSRCSVTVRDANVSREHCRLSMRGDKVVVVDLGSSHGLTYRGVRCHELEIDVGEGFHVGQTFVRFERSEDWVPPEVAPTPAEVAPVAAEPVAAGPVAAGLGEGEPPAEQSEQGVTRISFGAEPDPEFAIGAETFGFVVEAVLGHSDRCTVYRAAQRALHRRVALKVLGRMPAGLQGTQARDLFLTDCRTAALVSDPLLVQVLDIRAVGHVCFVAMELVDGWSLAARLAAGGPLPWHELVPVLADVLQALATLHEHGVVHGAVKPANVFLLRRGGAKLGDARSTAFARPTEAPHYCAPEQLRSEDVDQRADLYALACVAHEALTGRPPFVGSALQVLDAQLQGSLKSLRDAECALPPGLADLICERWLAPDSDDRPSSAAQARAELLDSRTLAAPAAPGAAQYASPSASQSASQRYANAPPPAREQARRRPASPSKALLARLTGELIVFSIIFGVGIVLLLLLKVACGFDIYSMLGSFGSRAQ
ncbi:MAG TPA: FHA domain-containing serine/threonine-protein kinase [Planctomycetota bacterium]|nr:FHA domain-containing serine/threonine-protein kinase [Planctomycetota bacterium]